MFDRILFDPGEQQPLNIDWPHGLAPADVRAPSDASAIPKVDVLVITWTAAEARALADVLTPGTQSTSWAHYATNFAAYESQLTGRSPAREAQRLGEWCPVTIGTKRVACFHSQLHPATDGPTLPTAQLVAQLAAECSPGLVITTGTAGGAGNGTQLGDVNVAQSVRADFTTRLANHPWSRGSWPTAALSAAQTANLAMLAKLAPTGKIPGGASLVPHVWNGDTVSTDFFAFDTQDDHFGLRAYDPAIRAVEMDDAAVAVGLQSFFLQYRGRVPFMSVRNASDPVMLSDSAANAKTAEEIYRKYGYWTTVNSAICTWAVIAGL